MRPENDHPPLGAVEAGAREEKHFALALLGICALGIVLRAVHLDIPMRYDETITYTAYASRGWEFLTTTYDTPNNHVLHTLLVSMLTGWLGAAPMVIRLPAFFAGCLLIPVVAWVATEAHGRRVGLIAATVVATTPVLIEFSVNARGYTILALCAVLGVGIAGRILRRSHWILWIALAEVGVVGMYTLPTMIIPWSGVCLWLLINLWKRGEGLRANGLAIAPLAAVNVVTGAIVGVLYTPIVLNEGLDALVDNRYVAALPFVDFAVGVPAGLAGIAAHWTRGVPVVVWIFAAVALLAAARLGGSGRARALGTSVLVGVAAVLLWKRNLGEPRTWLWMLPLIAIGIGVGTRWLADRFAGAHSVRAVAGVCVGWAAVMTGYLVVARPVHASLETGTFLESEAVVARIMEQYRPDDTVLSDFVSIEPLKFYMTRYAPPEEPEADESPFEVRRSWIVLNKGDPARVAGLEARVARMRAPALEESNPVFSIGNAEVYLYGVPLTAPDPRLLEAIDWYTGTASRVNDELARALLLEVFQETRSALSTMWMARCLSRGRMGYVQDEDDARFLAATVIDQIREIAAAGEPEAIFLMGTAYDEGLGAEIDAEEAVRWYRRAAETGHVLGQHNLGNVYKAGRGVEQSDSDAVYWWRLAAEQGDAVTQLRLGESYERGEGVERDPAQAVAWYTQAAERGNRDAREALDRLAR